MTELAASDVAALMPAHEAAPAATLVDDVTRRVGSLLVVADGMPSGALRELRTLASDRGFELLELDSRNGKGSAVARGIGHLLERDPPPAAVLVVDADGQHPPDAIPRFVAAARTAELVVGDRFGDLRSMPVARRIANLVASVVVSVAARTRVRDTQCGMRLLRGRALLDVRFPPGGYEAETTHLKACLERGVAVRWVPIAAVYGDEESSFRAVRDSIAVLRAAARRRGPA